MTRADIFRHALQNAAAIARTYQGCGEAAAAIAERIECLPLPEDGEMVLVPKEPTKAMIEAAYDFQLFGEFAGSEDYFWAGLYRAMIKAA